MAEARSSSRAPGSRFCRPGSVSVRFVPRRGAGCLKDGLQHRSSRDGHACSRGSSNARLNNALAKKPRLPERRVKRPAGCQAFVPGWGCYWTCILLPEFLKGENRPVSCQLLSKLLTTSRSACSKGPCSPGSDAEVQGDFFRGFVLLIILMCVCIIMGLNANQKLSFGKEEADVKSPPSCVLVARSVTAPSRRAELSPARPWRVRGLWRGLGPVCAAVLT